VYRGIGSGGYLVLYEIRVRVYRRGVGMQDHLRVAVVNSACSILDTSDARMNIPKYLDRLDIH
jgi:hypothetical protein